MPTLDEQFEAAVWIIQAMPKTGPIKPSISDMLTMYSLFKQATVGNCNTEQPYIFQIEQRMKWNSWKALEGMEKDEAKAKYVEKMLEMCDAVEEKHNLMDYLEDPAAIEVLEKQDKIRENFATLGRTNMKGHEGETVVIKGVPVQL